MSVRIGIKDTGSFKRPSLYKYFLLLLIELHQKSSVADFVVGGKASRDAVVVVHALDKCGICLMHAMCLAILKAVVVVLLSKC